MQRSSLSAGPLPAVIGAATRGRRALDQATAARPRRPTAAGVDATAYSSTSAAPAASRAWAACVMVAPVVTTSSTTSTRRSRTSGRARNTEPASRSRRVRPVCGPLVRRAIEQPAARARPSWAPMCRASSFALVEAALAAPSGAGRGPRDHIDPRVIATFDDLVHDEAGEVPADATPVAVLQAEHHVARPAGERHGGMDTVGLGSRRPPDEGESTGGAHRCTRGITSGTTCHEQHVLHHDEGV